MGLENIFHGVKLSKTEMTVLRFIQNGSEQCIHQGIRAVAEQCYNSPSSLVQLTKRPKSSGWPELVYFIKFNIIMPKLDAINDIDYMSARPEEASALLLASLKQQRILIHGSGFSQLTAQYIHNEFLVIGVDASLALWPDYEILEQKNTACFNPIWIISRSGRSSSAPNWVKVLEGREINLVCFTGNYQSPLVQAASTAFIIYDLQRFDDGIYWSNSSFGYHILGFERLLKMWFTGLRSSSQPPLGVTRMGGVPGWRLAPYPGYRVMRRLCRKVAYARPGLHEIQAAPFVVPLDAAQAGGIPEWRLTPYPGYQVIWQFRRVSVYA